MTMFNITDGKNNISRDKPVEHIDLVIGLHVSACTSCTRTMRFRRDIAIDITESVQLLVCFAALRSMPVMPKLELRCSLLGSIGRELTVPASMANNGCSFRWSIRAPLIVRFQRREARPNAQSVHVLTHRVELGFVFPRTVDSERPRPSEERLNAARRANE